MSKPFGGLLLPTITDLPAYSPYGKSGDHLWTREAWRTLAQHDALPPRDVPVGASIWYEADGPAPDGFGRYRHSRFMCRWMSRSLDEVVDVRVERLQDISEADAIAEGTYSYATQLAEDPAVSATDIEDLIGRYGEGRVRCLYAALWESINGPGSWAANPWVWVVTFKVLTP